MPSPAGSEENNKSIEQQHGGVRGSQSGNLLSRRRRDTALLQFDMEGLLAEEASKSAYYHAESKGGKQSGGNTSEAAVPEDAVATVTAAAADAAEGRFGASSGGRVANAVNDGLRQHHVSDAG